MGWKVAPEEASVSMNTNLVVVGLCSISLERDLVSMASRKNEII